jgi:hypothetical protein
MAKPKTHPMVVGSPSVSTQGLPSAAELLAEIRDAGIPATMAWVRSKAPIIGWL